MFRFGEGGGLIAVLQRFFKLALRLRDLYPQNDRVRTNEFRPDDGSDIGRRARGVLLPELERRAA